MKRAYGVDFEDVAQVLGAQLRDAPGEPEPRVVDENVQRAEGCDGLPHHRPDRTFVRDVGLYDQSTDAGGGKLPLQRLQPLGGARGEHYGGAPRRQLARRRLPDAARGTGDDRDPAFQRVTQVRVCRRDALWVERALVLVAKVP